MAVCMSNSSRRGKLEDEGWCKDFIFDDQRVEQARRLMPTEQQISEASTVLKILTNPTSVCILYLVSLQELCTCELSQALNKSRRSISYQLQKMRTARLVSYRMDGDVALYHASNPEVIALLTNLISPTSKMVPM